MLGRIDPGQAAGNHSPAFVGTVAKFLGNCCRHHAENSGDAGARKELAATTPDIRAAISPHQQGLLREAEQLYRNVLFDCLHNLGLLLAQSGRFEDAAAMLRGAIAQDPRSVDAHHNLGNVLAASGDPAGAAQSYRSAIALDEDHDEAHNNLATVLTRQGEMKEAMAHYQRALALRPDYVDAHVNLGNLFREQGRLDEAAVHLARAVTLNPGSGALHYQLSKIQRQCAVRTPKTEVDQLLEREYWLALAPGLHIDNRSLFSDVAYLELNPASVAQIKQEGYFQGSADWGLDVTLMADAVRALSAANLSPVFGYLYDEFWLPFFKLRSQYEALLGGRYYMLPDFWIWNVDPKKSEAGWAPIATGAEGLCARTAHPNPSPLGSRCRAPRRSTAACTSCPRNTTRPTGPRARTR